MAESHLSGVFFFSLIRQNFQRHNFLSRLSFSVLKVEEEKVEIFLKIVFGFSSPMLSLLLSPMPTRVPQVFVTFYCRDSLRWFVSRRVNY